MRITYSGIITWSFLALCSIIFLNLNGIFALVFGITAPFSPLMLLLCICILYVGIIKIRIRPSNLLLLAIGFYAAYVFIGSLVYLFDPSFKHAKTSVIELIRSYLSSIFIITAFYLAAKNFILRGKISFLLKVLLCFTLITSLFIAIGPVVGLTSYYNYATHVTLDESRQSGFFGNPNEAGAFGLYFMVIVLVAFSYFRGWGLPLMLLLALSIYVIFVSFSKAAIVVCVLLLVFYLVFNLRFISKVRIGNFTKPLLFVILLVSGVIYSYGQFFNYVQSLNYSQRTRLLNTVQIATGVINNNTTSERAEIYALVWDKIKSRPIMGYGLGVFHRLKTSSGGNALGAHNTQLLIWGESGIVPFCMFALLFILLGYYGWYHKDLSVGFLICGIVLVYFLDVAGTSHNGLDDRVSNALLGISLGLVQINRK